MSDDSHEQGTKGGGSRLRRIARASSALESLDFFLRFDQPTRSRAIDDVRRVRNVVDAFRSGLRDALSSGSTVYGWHVQAMFLEMVAALGDVALVKEEDQGLAYYEGVKIKLPDYRVVTRRGERLLIEVKNCRQKRPTDPFSISLGEVDGLRRYAELDRGAELRLAIYWSHWNIWTLIDPAHLDASGTRLSLEMTRAMRMNEMSILGDMLLATRSPLTLILHADLNATAAGNPRRGYPMTIGRVEMLCAGQALQTKLEKRLALFFMLYGPWKTENTVDLDNHRVQRITFTVAPIEQAPNRVDSLGFLSSLFSSYFNSATLGDDMTVRALRTTGPVDIGALVPHEYESGRLPIWRLVVQSTGPPTPTER